MPIIIREVAETEARAAALSAHLEQAKAELRAAGARSFEGVYIDANGVARSVDMEPDSHD